MANEMQAALKGEIMLQVNERLYLRGLISRELYEQARIRIVKNERITPAAAGSASVPKRGSPPT